MKQTNFTLFCFLLLVSKCADTDVSNKEKYPTFVRTFPPVTQITKAIISVLLHFQWKRFTLIVGTNHKQQTIAEKLLELANGSNITLNGRQDFKEPHIFLTTGNPFPGIVERTFIDTRVYVFLGDINGVVDMMTNMYDRGLLDTGEYIVIYVDLNTFDVTAPLKYFRRALDKPDEIRNIEACRSLLVITPSPASNPNYKDFQRIVNDYNKKPPFNFPHPFPVEKRITVYAAYLYDAVMLYAKAASDFIMEGGSILNGTGIINKIRSTTFKSIRGVISHINKQGDAEGNYTFLARVPYVTSYSMQPVGHFEMDKESLLELKFFSGMSVAWVSGKPPIDEPKCGYRGEYCIPVKKYTFEIVGGVLGGILLIVIIVALVVYRNWRYEQEIAGLLWKIRKELIRLPQSKGNSHDRREIIGSKFSLNSQQSFDSKMSFMQIYTRTATYKGQIVAMKLYEKKDLVINRRMQKQMKLMRDIRHNNVNTFIGACIDPPSFIILTEYCAKGSLQDILENEDVTLDEMFRASLVKDMIQGMLYLHGTELSVHGNLKSSNCVVNSRWTLQVADFGLLNVRAGTYKKEDEHAFFRNLYWKAPEHLRQSHVRGSQKGDVYSFGIILHEIIGRAGPYGYCNMEPKSIVENIKKGGPQSFRPDTKNLNVDEYVVDCMKLCWDENPEERPDFRMISKDLSLMRKGMKRNIFDNMIEMMESYQHHLEELVEARTELLVEEKKKTEALLNRMLPSPIAEQLKRGRHVEPEIFSSVTIYFSDICGFTQLSADSTPMQVVDLLNDLYTCFDSIVKNYEVYKVETIGDAYMVVSGVPNRNGDNHAGEIASMSLELLRAIKRFKIRHRPTDTLLLRIGIHSGPCVAGVVGLTMPRYTLFGDTVNTASRMESNGEALRIHCSKECKEILDKLGGYTLEERGFVSMKGKGELFTYWLTNEEELVRHERLRRCSEVFKYNSPWARESRRVYLRHGDSAHLLEDQDNDPMFFDQTSETDVPCQQPLVDILRETDTNSFRSDSPKQLSANFEKCDSPKSTPNKGFKSPIEKKIKHSPNGLLSEGKCLRLIDRTGSGQNLVRTALMSDIDGVDVLSGQTRHDSFTNRIPKGQADKRQFTLPTGNNNNSAPTVDDSMEETCCNSEYVTVPLL